MVVLFKKNKYYLYSSLQSSSHAMPLFFADSKKEVAKYLRLKHGILWSLEYESHL